MARQANKLLATGDVLGSFPHGALAVAPDATNLQLDRVFHCQRTASGWHPHIMERAQYARLAPGTLQNVTRYLELGMQIAGKPNRPYCP